MSKYLLNKDVLLQQVGEDVIVLEPLHGNYFTLNASGAVMLKLLLSMQNIDNVISSMQNHFEASEDELREDLEALLGQLLEHELIVIR